MYIAAKVSEVCDLAVTDACKFWRRYQQRKATPTQISAEQFRASFAGLVGDENSSAHSLRQHAPPSSPLMPELNTDTYDSEDEHDHQLHAPISEAEITLAFKRLMRHKTAGIDGIRAKYMLDTEDLLVAPWCIPTGVSKNKDRPTGLRCFSRNVGH